MGQSAQQKRFGCAAALSIFFSLCAVLSLLGILLTGPYSLSVWIPGAKTADAVIEQYEYVPIRRIGPDGDRYDDSEPHAVLRFQTEDGEERTFTNATKAKTTGREGRKVAVCYNKKKAMIASDYRTAMRSVRKYFLRLVLSAAGFILLVIWCVIIARRRKNNEKAAEKAAGSE